MATMYPDDDRYVTDDRIDELKKKITELTFELFEAREKNKELLVIIKDLDGKGILTEEQAEKIKNTWNLTGDPNVPT